MGFRTSTEASVYQVRLGFELNSLLALGFLTLKFLSLSSWFCLVVQGCNLKPKDKCMQRGYANRRDLFKAPVLELFLQEENHTS